MRKRKESLLPPYWRVQLYWEPEVMPWQHRQEKGSSTGNKASTDDTSGTQGNRRPGNGESGSMGAFCLGDEDGTSCRNPRGNREKTEG